MIDQKKLNILFIIGWPLNHGGHINSTLNHAKYLLRFGHNVFLIAPQGKKVEEFIGIGVHYFKMRSSSVSAVMQIIFKSILHGINIIHAMDYEALKKAVPMKIFLKKPLVYTKAGGTIPNYVLPPIDALIVFSLELYNHFAQQLVLGPPIYLIKERIDIETFKPKTITKSDSEKVVLMAMRLENQKSPWLNTITDLIRINHNLLKEYHFIFLGYGKLFDYYKSIAEEINILAGRELLTINGAIEDVKEINNAYNSADIIIGHGRGIMEAMACGKTVIILGEDKQFEIVNQDNIEAISYFNFSGRHFRIQKQIEDKNFIECLSLSIPGNKWSRSYIEKNYDAEIGAQKLNDIYITLPNSRTPVKIIRWYLMKIQCPSLLIYSNIH